MKMKTVQIDSAYGLYVNYKSTQTLMNRRFLAVSLGRIAHIRSWSGLLRRKQAPGANCGQRQTCDSALRQRLGGAG
jgi:hypothetical protein